MIEELQNLRNEALQSLELCNNDASLEEWRVRYLSRQGSLPILLEKMRDIPKEQRPIVGKTANETKESLNSAFEEAKSKLESKPGQSEIDASLPGRPVSQGALHPITQTTNRIVSIFRAMGYRLAYGPDIETEFHNFDALNTPKDHPARNEQDTFYVNLPPHGEFGRLLMRTQTSPVQIRTMMAERPPIQIIAPGRCYRRDEVDATHGMFFHQIEGLVIRPGISLDDLFGTMQFFFQELLGSETRVRFRPHFFPFTEPSFEVDLSHRDLQIRGKEWLEICGCGMVDPNVLQTVGIDPETHTGFAFGMGVERITMMLHQIPDIRFFFENDVRFLRQFRNFAA